MTTIDPSASTEGTCAAPDAAPSDLDTQSCAASPAEPDGAAGKDSLKGSLGAFMDGGVSRRGLFARAAAAGVSAATVGRLSAALADEAADPAAADKMELVEGRGGDAYVAQLKKCGVDFVFFNPSTGSAPIFDAVLSRGDMNVILCPHEGPVTAMANGYAKASGKTPFVTVSRLGFPNTTMNIYNAYKDRTPMVVATDQVPDADRGGLSFQEVDDLIGSVGPYTRWRWETRTVHSIAADVRRAFKFAKTPPYGPVFLTVPENQLAETTTQGVADIARFSLADAVRPDAGAIELTLDKLLAAQSPLLIAGDDVYTTKGEPAVVALAELLQIPVVHPGTFWRWANAFPTDHPLYVGEYQRSMRFPRNVDFVLNLGGAIGVPGALPEGAEMIEVRSDIERMGRVHPAALSLPANARIFAEDLTEAVERRVDRGTKRRWREGRGAATAQFSERLRGSHAAVAQAKWDGSSLTPERIATEFARKLDPDAIFVHELDGGRAATRYFTYGEGKMGYFTSTGTGLGWAFGAAAGVKIAQPGRQVVAMSGDGSFLFETPNALWSMARYSIPVLGVVFNNHAYDGERRRIWAENGVVQAEQKRDMMCHLGDPNIDFTAIARGYGVAAAKVAEPQELASAIDRGLDVLANGEPFVLDVEVGRAGVGADLAWYPPYSVAT